ncbi:ATP synthase subunit beta [Terrihabitans soli]|uniref:ATP synthase subunit beta n=1 Tax=Terrihabitans soli TaxID=708113 RepID=A0A6S6QS55_9HYPH|nr:SAM-dependent methyltransferase [Terrihabitans soli]BCJ90112.1 ATP synthase subunit beta [Terrihabitans soli]
MTPVEADLRRRIESEGPVTVATLIQLANAHYYATRDPFGTAGDFITAPEISQIFGELIGLWCAAIWSVGGRPDPVHLVEIGPGRGTLMLDALRALKVAPALRSAVKVHLVETSPLLRAAQERTLKDAGVQIEWHHNIGQVPKGPAFFIANEFFDALPVHHYVRGAKSWHERVVGLIDDVLTFGLSPLKVPDFAIPEAFRGAPEGSIIEISPESARIAREIAARVEAQGGAALFIDYGYARPGLGETLQALRGHAFVDALKDSGEADLTAHVDFSALASAAKDAGAAPHGPMTQRDFLLGLGILERTAMLMRQASLEQALALESGTARLIEDTETGMGRLFKVMAVTPRNLPAPPGFTSMPA